MQTLDIISVNLWQILISLANLVIIFLILKKFFYQPVKNILEKRQAEIDQRYSDAEEAKKSAKENQAAWEEKMKSASSEADSILKTATATAEKRSETIVSDAKQKAEGILRRAETEAELELKKAADQIKREIVEVSGVLTEKMLEREINSEDHRGLIDSFLENVGEEDA